MTLKRLRFFYRYLFSPRRIRRWLNARTLVVVVITVGWLVTLYSTAPFSKDEKPERPREIEATAVAAAALRQATDSPEGAPTQSGPPTRTPLPPEYFQTESQSAGISIAASILVMIVVFGALAFMPHHEDDGKS